MRKSVLFVAALLFMAVPAMAAPSRVTITCTPSTVGDVNWVTVSYSTDHNLIRAFGLDITLTPTDGNIVDVCSFDLNYRIYPGQIEINANGEVTDYNKPYAFSDINDANNNIAIEMGSLYTTDSNYASDSNAGYNMIPGTSGTLLKFAYINATGYTVDVNVRRGGIVMEDPCETPTLDSPLCSSDCFYKDMVDKCGRTITQAMVDRWVTLGKPDCWCYPCHCRGDINNDGLINNTDLKGVAAQSWKYAWITYHHCSDTNYDGSINNSDLKGTGLGDGWRSGWNNGCPP
jgi:hypothetical protein